MVAFGIIGMIFGLAAFAKLMKLEKHLKETGVLNKDYK